MNNYITNCPNCGAPLHQYGYCDYCGTRISQPVQIIAHRPGYKKLVCQTQIPMELTECSPDAAVYYAEQDICTKMSEALKSSIKFLTRRDFNPRDFNEVITVRGELWVAESDIRY